MKTKPTDSEINAARLVLRSLGGFNSASRMTPEQRKERARKAGLAGKGKSRKRKKAIILEK
jgi:hypothetical protein